MPAAAFPGDSGVSLQITIPRGSDGFGFTICCDSPVRVQAVDSGKRSERFYPSRFQGMTLLLFFCFPEHTVIQELPCLAGLWFPPGNFTE